MIMASFYTCHSIFLSDNTNVKRASDNSVSVCFGQGKKYFALSLAVVVEELLAEFFDSVFEFQRLDDMGLIGEWDDPPCHEL